MMQQQKSLLCIIRFLPSLLKSVTCLVAISDLCLIPPILVDRACASLLYTRYTSITSVISLSILADPGVEVML